MRWLACELHSHTFHSDGRQTLQELAGGAKALGFDCIALTDHNTMTGLQDREAVEREAGITIIPGMEWTTFYGHMVTIGLQEFVDWRVVGPSDIHKGISEVHKNHGIVGMAHPFRMGSPICTGCFWEFEIRDWNDINYIEIWSGTFPSIKKDNARALELWTDRLNAGYRIAATSGRDWHVQAATEEPMSVTYLRVDKEDGGTIQEQAIQALSRGRASLTMGPLVTLDIETPQAVYGIGDIVILSGPNSKEYAPVQAHVKIDFAVREGLWDIPEQTLTLRLTGRSGVLAERSVTKTEPDCRIQLSTEKLLWVRAELWGIIRGVRAMIAVTNPVYLSEVEVSGP